MYNLVFFYSLSSIKLCLKIFFFFSFHYLALTKCPQPLHCSRINCNMRSHFKGEDIHCEINIIIPICQVKMLSLKEVTYVTQFHTACHHSNPANFTLYSLNQDRLKCNVILHKLAIIIYLNKKVGIICLIMVN